MSTNESVRFSKALTRFNKDLESYRDATGKAANEVIARQALNFSIRFSKRLAAEAPDKSELTAEKLGYNVKVRKRIRDKVGAISPYSDLATRKTFGTYSGRIKRTVGGKKFTNKRALAVHRELAARRASVKWLSKSVAKWKAAQNSELPENKRVDLGEAYTRRKKTRVGSARGRFTRNSDSVLVKASAFALTKVSRQKGGLVEKALKETSADIGSYLARKNLQAFRKNLRKKYN